MPSNDSQDSNTEPAAAEVSYCPRWAISQKNCSAYDALKADRDKWQAFALDVRDDHPRVAPLKAEIEKLKADNERLQQVAHVTGEETYRAKAKVWLDEVERLRLRVKDLENGHE